MQPRFLRLACLFFFFSFNLHAQNTSPFWSLAGNSNVATTSKLGTTNSIPLNLTTNNVTRLRIGTDGKVGIGTTSPQQLFHVEGSTLLSIFVSTSPLSNISGSGMIGYTKFLPTASGQRLGYFLVGSRGGAENNYNAAGMAGYAAGSWTAGSSYPAYLTFETTPVGSTSRSERLRITSSGDIGIGTTSPSSKLHVAGSGRFTARLYVDDGGFYTNNNSGNGIEAYGTNDGVHGEGTSNGVSGSSNYGTGVSGSGAYAGVYGYGNRFGVYGQSSETDGYGVEGNGYYLGVYGVGNSYGVYGSSVNTGTAVYGTTDGGTGVYGEGFMGVKGVMLHTENGYNSGYGVYGSHNGNGGGSAVRGYSSASAYGVTGYSQDAIGVQGYTANSSSYAGYFQGNVYTTGLYQSSDKKLKQNINDLGRAMDLIVKLKPKTYEYRQDGNFKLMNLPQGKQYGLLAQDLEDVLPSLVKESHFNTADAMPDETTGGTKNAPVAKRQLPLPSSTKDKLTGPKTDADAKDAAPLTTVSATLKEKRGEVVDFKAVNYIEFIPIMIKGLQELNEKDKEIDELKAEVTELRQMVLELKAGRNNATVISGAYLEQNVPNPARGNTSVRYTIPEGTASAKLTLINAKGQTVKEIPLANSSMGQLALNTAALPSGVYTYTLWVNGQKADTKQLVIAR